ncbi:methylenetetrahydrofolate reductase [NAD(P)H] [Pseudaestuariivita atlantica]|uniref:Methylenetetrahydrofolate reductase n=1 Tax=Pseudaestuariivita atlantica TaxID=1317121 RepID=A0A0L1JRN8_9RHOB|nr:methylenetetrahydrofolate reductase [NAD(P)H] [Pseudaestuariivita atlantica]KNG94420.1 5,10-methylenetetrahydrofolate reductase [Pseudaestuariivita atlantica]
MPLPAVSFEFFPPQTMAGSFRLWDAVQTLAPLDPRFVSVTYGAGGTTRDLTVEAVDALSRQTDLTVAAHLTCVDATREETLDLAARFAKVGVRDLVALRGDPAKGSGAFEPAPGGFAGSVELIAALAETGQFTLRVGAYPDPHPEAASPTADVDHLAAKIDAGAHEALTQFFFEPETFLRFRDACAARGIAAPITPGILPIEDWSRVKRFAARCGAKVPTWLDEAFATADRDGRSDLLAVAVCTELCSTLIDEGVETLHFYTLNRPELTRDICCALGLRPRASLQKVA